MNNDSFSRTEYFQWKIDVNNAISKLKDIVHQIDKELQKVIVGIEQFNKRASEYEDNFDELAEDFAGITSQILTLVTEHSTFKKSLDSADMKLKELNKSTLDLSSGFSMLNKDFGLIKHNSNKQLESIENLKESIVQLNDRILVLETKIKVVIRFLQFLAGGIGLVVSILGAYKAFSDPK